MLTDKERQFILELACLTRKHRIAIGGCGCCGSPFLDTLDIAPSPDDGYMSHSNAELQWVSANDPFSKGDLDKVIK